MGCRHMDDWKGWRDRQEKSGTFVEDTREGLASRKKGHHQGMKGTITLLIFASHFLICSLDLCGMVNPMWSVVNHILRYQCVPSRRHNAENQYIRGMKPLENVFSWIVMLRVLLMICSIAFEISRSYSNTSLKSMTITHCFWDLNKTIQLRRVRKSLIWRNINQLDRRLTF